jgi:hypothetical protein
VNLSIKVEDDIFDIYSWDQQNAFIFKITGNRIGGYKISKLRSESEGYSIQQVNHTITDRDITVYDVSNIYLKHNLVTTKRLHVTYVSRSFDSCSKVVFVSILDAYQIVVGRSRG